MISALVCECHAKKVTKRVRLPFPQVSRYPWHCPMTGDPCNAVEAMIPADE